MDSDKQYIDEQLTQISNSVGMPLDINIYLDNQPVASRGHLITEKLIQRLARLDVSRIKLSREALKLSVDDVDRLVEDTIRPHAVDIVCEAGIDQDLTEEARQMATRKIKEIFESCRYLTKLDLDAIADLATSLLNRVSSLDSSAFKLHDLKQHDDYTYYHSVNVCVLGTTIFRDQIHNEQELIELGIGLLLHDIGKSKIDLKILNKPARLNDEEFTMMKRHVMYGYNLVKNNNEISPLAKDLILNHHERVNRTGYSRGLGEIDLSFFDMLAAICDVFDAITTDRVYQKRMDIHRAVSVLVRGAATQFQTRLVNAFLRGIGRFPVGTFVLLSNGEIGIVSKVHHDALSLPVIKVIFDAGGTRLTEPTTLDLYEQQELYIDRPLDISFTPHAHIMTDTGSAM